MSSLSSSFFDLFSLCFTFLKFLQTYPTTYMYLNIFSSVLFSLLTDDCYKDDLQTSPGQLLLPTLAVWAFCIISILVHTQFSNI